MENLNSIERMEMLDSLYELYTVIEEIESNVERITVKFMYQIYYILRQEPTIGEYECVEIIRNRAIERGLI